MQTGFFFCVAMKHTILDFYYLKINRSLNNILAHHCIKGKCFVTQFFALPHVFSFPDIYQTYNQTHIRHNSNNHKILIIKINKNRHTYMYKKFNFTDINNKSLTVSLEILDKFHNKYQRKCV